MAISRRRILSQSREEMSGANDPYGRTRHKPFADDEDAWYSKEKLYKDHISEILEKWDKIDDEIWAKLIVLERNRRVAKAYARAPILTVNGSKDGFDGYRIGLNGFGNPMRDLKTAELKAAIGAGVKIKMDDQGNILIKRLAKSAPVLVGHWNGIDELDGEDTLSSEPALGRVHNGGALEPDKTVVLFDMKAFTGQVQRELMSAYPDRKRLEAQCISCIVFGRSESGSAASGDLLSTPCWVMLINIIAMDMLKSKLPQPINKRQSVPNFATAFERSKHGGAGKKNSPANGSYDEDPYSLPGNIGGSSSSSLGASGGSEASSSSSGQYASALMVTDHSHGGPPGRSSSSGPSRHGLVGPFDSSDSGGSTFSSGDGMGLGASNSNESSPARNKNGNGKVHKPPKLPPRDLPSASKISSKKEKKKSKSHSHLDSSLPHPDYSGDGDDDEENIYDVLPIKRPLADEKPVVDWRDEDPYYCGFRARVPNYTKNTQRSGTGPQSKLQSKVSEQTSHQNASHHKSSTLREEVDGSRSKSNDKSSRQSSSKNTGSNYNGGSGKLSSSSKWRSLTRFGAKSPPPLPASHPPPGSAAKEALNRTINAPVETAGTTERRKNHITGYLNTLFRKDRKNRRANNLQSSDNNYTDDSILSPSEDHTNRNHQNKYNYGAGMQPNGRHHGRSASYQSFYDSSLESDPYALGGSGGGSSGDGTDPIYGVYTGPAGNGYASRYPHGYGGHPLAPSSSSASNLAASIYGGRSLGTLSPPMSKIPGGPLGSIPWAYIDRRDLCVGEWEDL